LRLASEQLLDVGLELLFPPQICLNPFQVIDIHSHILPEVDDGPQSWETAEAMCRMAAQDGIDHMVATPHANDRYFYDRGYLAGLLSHLQQRIGEKPKLSLGCDFHLSYENMQSAVETPARYCIGETRYLLVEFSNFNIPQQLDTWLREMCERGYTPILTHPERNPILQDSTERILKWVKEGCAVQITANALTGSWGDRARHAAQNLLKKRAVHFLATDAHDTLRRPPILSAARKLAAKEYGEALATALVESNPSAVINNQPLAGRV
jgi:protein-tyrosine phosphatase